MQFISQIQEDAAFYWTKQETMQVYNSVENLDGNTTKRLLKGYAT